MTNNDYSRSVKDFVREVHTVLCADHTIEEAIASLRHRKIDEKIIYFYVIDDEGRLKGVVSTRSLLLKDPQLSLEKVMEKNVVCLRENQTLEEAMEVLSRHHLLAIPVVDGKQRFVGVIDVQLYLEESVEIADARHSSDVFQILGLTLEEGRKHTSWKNYRIRMPWILCNMAGGLACAVVSRFYSEVLGKFLLLAMFIPLVLTLSESISMQSMTQSLHIVRHQKHSWHRVFQRMFVEGKMVILLSVTSGVAVGLLSLLWGSGFLPSATIAVGIIASISVSASIGSSIPLLLHAKKLDPKVASGPVVLMLADVITTSLYLSLATWWLL